VDRGHPLAEEAQVGDRGRQLECGQLLDKILGLLRKVSVGPSPRRPTGFSRGMSGSVGWSGAPQGGSSPITMSFARSHWLM
jgi:hypothetical protein